MKKLNFFAYWVFVLAAAIVIHNQISIVFNKSYSLPGRVFLVLKGVEPKRGDLFGFRYAGTDFYKRGRVMVKMLKGVEGDELRTVGREIWINDHYVSKAKTVSLDGKPLTMTHERKLEHGEFYAHGTHIDSYDSRYENMGIIQQNQIIGKAFRVF